MRLFTLLLNGNIAIKSISLLCFLLNERFLQKPFNNNHWKAMFPFCTRSIFSAVYLRMCPVYLSALSPQMPPKRDEAALQEEEELQLAIALSQSEAEEKERMV